MQMMQGKCNYLLKELCPPTTQSGKHDKHLTVISPPRVCSGVLDKHAIICMSLHVSSLNTLYDRCTVYMEYMPYTNNIKDLMHKIRQGDTSHLPRAAAFSGEKRSPR